MWALPVTWLMVHWYSLQGSSIALQQVNFVLQWVGKKVIIEWLLYPGSTGPLQPLAVHLVCSHMVQKNIT